MVGITILVLREQAALQTIIGQTEAATLLQEVRLLQIAGREAHQRHRQAHQAGVVLLQVVVEHQEARQAEVVAAVVVAVDQDN